MPNVPFSLVFAYILLNLIGLKLVKQQHYWKVLLITSLISIIALSKLGFLVILGIVGLTYLFANAIKRGSSFKAGMFGLILLPLLIKKIFIREYQFDEFVEQELSAQLLMQIVGLSYITFNAIGYLMDVKRRYITPQPDFFKLLLYLVYFPIVFSGPLTRAKHFFGQLENIQLERASIVSGLRLILWGVFKNIVIGTRLLVLMKILLRMELHGPSYLLVGFAFYLFLYCTFSSFINIFQGVSLIFNIQINENFKNRIYFSASREEFWKGWHITLNQWFRDYFFYEFIKYDKNRKYTNVLLFITFLMIALWHDFTWVFLTWGTLNATWLIAERKWRKRVTAKVNSRFLGILYHTTLASFLATIFISESITDLWTTLTNISAFTGSFEPVLVPNTLITLLLFVGMDFYEKRSKNIGIDKYIAKQPKWHRYTFYYALVLLILFLATSPNMMNYYNLF